MKAADVISTDKTSEQISKPIFEHVCSQVEQGILKPGDRLGTAKELAQKWGLSFGNVRQSLEKLAEKGVVVRKPGTHEPPVFVGIGSNCQVAMDLSNLDVRGEAGPFDWVDSSATAVVTHFATRFARYPMPVPVAGGWWDASTDVSFHHDDFNGQREAEMAKYARRTARVVEALDRGGHVVLLRYGTLAETAAMCELGRAIHTAYGGATAVIYLLTAEVNLSHNQTISEGGICVCILHRNSILAVINRHCNS